MIFSGAHFNGAFFLNLYGRYTSPGMGRDFGLLPKSIRQYMMSDGLKIRQNQNRQMQGTFSVHIKSDSDLSVELNMMKTGLFSAKLHIVCGVQFEKTTAAETYDVVFRSRLWE